jgi:hypothetical protein
LEGIEGYIVEVAMVIAGCVRIEARSNAAIVDAQQLIDLGAGSRGGRVRETSDGLSLPPFARGPLGRC